MGYAKEISGAIALFCVILTVTVILQIYTCVKNYRTVYQKSTFYCMYIKNKARITGLIPSPSPSGWKCLKIKFDDSVFQ